MYTTINNVKIHYHIFGEGEPIILLHGWGGSTKSLIPLSRELVKKGFYVYMLDLPGFGKSELPLKAYTLDDYAILVEEYVKRFHQGAIAIFGHSFGGSVAIKIASRKKIDINKLILCNSSGIREKRFMVVLLGKFATIMKIIFSLPLLRDIYPFVRKVSYYYILRQRDYIDHQDKKETFQNIVSEDIIPDLPNIMVRTLLLWGENDKDTPVSQANIMKLKIKDSRLKIVEKAGHGLPLKDPRFVAEEINNLVKH